MIILPKERKQALLEKLSAPKQSGPPSPRAQHSRNAAITTTGMPKPPTPDQARVQQIRRQEAEAKAAQAAKLREGQLADADKKRALADATAKRKEELARLQHEGSITGEKRKGNKANIDYAQDLANQLEQVNQQKRLADSQRATIQSQLSELPKKLQNVAMSSAPDTPPPTPGPPGVTPDVTKDVQTRMSGTGAPPANDPPPENAPPPEQVASAAPPQGGSPGGIGIQQPNYTMTE